MYIEPNSRFILLKGCPLDNTYTHTIWFKDKTAQFDYFYGLKKYEYSEQSYQRYNRGTVRVRALTASLYDCNYIMFQNTAYDNKWFYAFILGVEYINDKCAEIKYQIDVMQTWYFDYEMKYSFVEREHSRTDIIGENLVPENLETGEIIIREDGMFDGFDSMSIIISTTFDENYQDKLGANYGGMFSGTILHKFNSINDAIEFIDGATGKSDGIFSMFMMPNAFVNDTSLHTLANFITVDMEKPYTDIDGYKPRNKKLFVYPYNYLYVSSQQGESGELKYEFFDDTYLLQKNNFRIGLQGDFSATPSIMLTPCYYKGVKKSSKNENAYSFDENLFINNMPQLSFATDTYKAWYAQHENSMLLHTVIGSISALYAGLGGVVGSYGDSEYAMNNSIYQNGGASGSAGAIIRAGSTFNNIMGVIGGVEGAKADVKNHANKLHGTTSNNLLTAIKRFGFYWAKKTITFDFAKRIDHFFDMFGYAVNDVKKPEITGAIFPRKYWCYTKTRGCEVIGEMPTDDLKTIISIYDKGITFWKNGENVGDYSLDNSV